MQSLLHKRFASPTLVVRKTKAKTNHGNKPMIKILSSPKTLFSLSLCLLLGPLATTSTARKQGHFAFIGSYSSSFFYPLFRALDDAEITLASDSPFFEFKQNMLNAEAVSRIVHRKKVESIFTTGDNNYEYGCRRSIDHNIGRLYSSYIGNYIGNYGEGATVNEFFPALGNHDKLAYEGYLIKNGLPITLGLFGQEGGVTTYRLSRQDWENLFGQLGLPASEIFQRLLDEEKLGSTRVQVEDGTTGTSYWPTERIVLDDFTPSQKDQIKSQLATILGVSSSSVPKSVYNKILHTLFNLYCVLDQNLNAKAPYFKYFDLPGNERYYKVTKSHAGSTVDFFILNTSGTFNSSSGWEKDGTEAGSRQHRWFVQEAESSEADFKIAIVHDEPYGSYQQDSTIQRWNLEQYVDVVLSGDVQAYERNWIHTEHGSAHFLSVGVGGLSLEDGIPRSERASSSQVLLREHGSVFMRIRSQKIEFEFRNKNNQVRDAFFVSRASTSSKKFGSKRR